MGKLGDAHAATARVNKFRPDIQGLRALAVVLVVADHFIGIPRGGFIGVDVFFAISGFLITGQLVREFQQKGWIHLPGFYARRIRRIVPVAFIVAVAVIICSWLIWFAPRAMSTTVDGMSAALWVSNWHFIGIGTDYLNASGPVSPFQHYWSLSIEEQFYLIWPLLLLSTPLLMRINRKLSKQTVIMLLIIVVTLCSFVWSVYWSISRPTFAYFDLFGRAWEFGLGALIGLLPAAKLKQGFITRSIPSIGLVTIIAGAFWISPDTTFPGPYALMPVAATLTVIWGNSSQSGYGMSLLTNRVMVFIGQISFSIYLWHFPVVIFAESLLPESTPLLNISCVILTLILSIATYFWVEQPARRSRWLRSWEEGAKRSEAHLSVVKTLWPSVALLLSIALIALLQVKGAAPLKDGTFWLSLSGTSSPASAPYRFLTEEELNLALVDSVGSNVSPAVLTPQINQLTDIQQSPAMRECRNALGNDVPITCNYGSESAPNKAFIIGDSVAMSWVPAIVGALGAKSWNIQALGYASCSPFEVDFLPRIYSAEAVSKCQKAKQIMIDKAIEAHPDVIFLSGSHSFLASGAVGTAARDEYSRGIVQTLQQLSASGAEIVVLPTPPQVADTRSCINRLTELRGCISGIRELDTPLYEGEVQGVQRANSLGINAHMIPVTNWFCDKYEKCPDQIGGLIVRTDSLHLTNAFAESLSLVLAQRLKQIGLD